MSAAACLARFTTAVRDGKSGDYGAAKDLVKRVRDQFGEVAAEIARRELWAAIGSKKWDKK